MNARSVWLTAVSLAVLSLGLAFEVSGMRTRLLGRKRYRFVYATQSSRSDEAELSSGSGFEARTVTLGDGTRLRALVSRSLDKGKPWVVYFPGNDAAQLEGGRKVLEALRGTAKLNLCALSYRGFSGSSGTPEVKKIQNDLVELTQTIIDNEQISELHLVGFSIGGYFAARTAGSLANLGTVPRSLTLFAPGYDLVMLRPSRFERLAPGDDYQMQSFLPQVRSPSLVLQGSADDAFMGPGQGQEVARELGALAQYEEFPGVKHEELLLHLPALERAHAFIVEKVGSGR